MTWPKMFKYLQLFWLLWCLNLLLSLSCFWLCAFSPADEGVLVWLGEKVLDTVELLLVWDCPLSMIIFKLWMPLFVSLPLTFSSLSCVNFLRIKWFQCWIWVQNFSRKAAQLVETGAGYELSQCMVCCWELFRYLCWVAMHFWSAAG